MLLKLKDIIQNNSWLFSLFRYIPYSFRLGMTYNTHKKLAENYCEMSDEEKENLHFKKLKKLLDWAYKNNDFYRCFYSLNNFHPSSFKEMADFVKVPIVTKNDLKEFELKNRSQTNNSPFKVNTGGTSGEPLEFYLDKSAFSREWAYMHTIWSKLGYSYLDSKLTFRGKNNNGIPLKYNVIHNEYIVDAYVSYEEVVKAIALLVKRKKIKYLHGYPSSIYAFCKYLKEHNIDSSELFKDQLKGVFFGSEYPAPMYRKLIEEVLGVATISWYGHSEMAILAYEKKECFTYCPFQTYGFTETISNENGESRLIGTSYYNFNSPFIRYDTGDLVTDEVFDNKILKSFKISSGRIGDFIFDKNDNPISLTALIFGRHHEAFNEIEFLQIKQSSSGKAVLCVTSKNTLSLESFDLENVDIEFSIEQLEKPFKTKAGKVPLLIPQL